MVKGSAKVQRIIKTATTTAAVLLLSACGGTDAAETLKGEEALQEPIRKEAETQEDTTVTLAAAASLEYAFTERLIPAFEAANPGIRIEGVYDSSGKLQTQIEAGLPADIFFSAAEKQMDALDAEGYVQSGTITDYLENRIVLIVPKEAGSDIASFQDLSKAEMIALGDPESVPAGQYAREVLTNLGIWEELQGKISFGTNVTEVLNWVAEGSADCGIVYATDAAATDRVTVVSEAPEGSLDTPVVYPAALLKQTEVKNTDAAELFFEYILSDEAYSVFAEYGFADHRSE